MYQRSHGKAVPDMFARTADVDLHEEQRELHSILGLRDNKHFRKCEKELFSSYPSVLNDVGESSQDLWCCSCDYCRKRDVPAGDAVFRQLPNGGQQSPQSALFCYMTDPHSCHHSRHVPTHPHVYGMSRAAVCLNTSLETQQDDETQFNLFDYFDMLSSDSDVNDLLASGHDPHPCFPENREWRKEYDEHCKVFRELHDGSVPKAKLLTDLKSKYTPEDRVEQFFERFDEDWNRDWNNLDGISELKSYALSHFAAGGSSHCPILNGRMSAIEDKCLSVEAVEEAATDLGYALERLREGIADYEAIVRKVSRCCLPLVYSLVSCALSVAGASTARLVNASAYAVFNKQKRPHAELSRVRALCRGGLLHVLVNRMARRTHKAHPSNIKDHRKMCTALAKRACDFRIANHIIETQTQTSYHGWMARLAQGSEYK
jgi:hypothetical protein